MENKQNKFDNLEVVKTLAWAISGILLMLAVAAEGYYIFVLKDRIEQQSEELINTSLQLQSLRNAHSALQGELDAIKKSAGDLQHGNTSQRQH